LSRRLKRKIRDICQLDGLSKEERRATAAKILNDSNAKQKLCNACPGLSFKDIERAMKDILAEKLPTEEEIEKLAIPEKFNPAPLIANKTTTVKMRYKILSLEETQALMAASNAPFELPPVSDKAAKAHPTYTLEEAVALINGTYDPNNFKKGILKRKR
jgi:hypothetical protein